MSYSDLQLATHAKYLREELDLNQYTTISNIENLVDGMGHILEIQELGSDFSATCMTVNGINFVIALNKDQMWNERFKRFTIAHELGHISLIEHHAEMIRNGGILKSKVEFRSNKRIEQEADKFAAFFLAPTPLVKKITLNLEFKKTDLKLLTEQLNISLLAGAFRFVNVTDLCCSLIVVDNKTQKIRYEIRSKSMRDYNRHEYIHGNYIPEKGLVSKSLVQALSDEIDDEQVDISEYYYNNYTGLRCNESVFNLNYNNTTIVMLSVLDDLE